jgi:hypothetical protein
VRALGYEAAFGQHSGALDASADFFALPRFALNETYGEPERFALIADVLPLPVSDLTPVDPVLRDANPPALGFTVDPAIGRLDRLSCFVSHTGPVAYETLGSHRVELRFAAPFPPGRTRVNCTLPGAGGRWRWFGMQFVVP